MEEKLRNDFAIPNQLSPSVIIGFGYPASRLTGKKKKRLPIHELVYYEKYLDEIINSEKYIKYLCIV